VRAYWELAKSGFRSSSRYRTAALAALFTNTIFGLIRASLMLSAITTVGHDIGGYNRQQAATYVWLGQAFIAPLGVFGFREVADRVKSGDIAVDFLRPTDLVSQYVARNLGRAAYDILPRSIPILIVGAIITGITLPTNAGAIAMGVLSLLIAMQLTFFGFMIVNLLALWIVDARGYLNLYMIVFNLLAGFLVPVSWFPDWLVAIAHTTPFPSMVQVPIDMFTGALAGARAWTALAGQVGWTLLLLALCVAMARAGARRVVVQGG